MIRLAHIAAAISRVETSATLRAEPGSAVAAVPAVAAAPRALEDHPVALGHSMDGRGRPSQPLDPSEDLMAQNHRVGHVDAAMEVLHIGAAHPAQLDTQQRTVVGHLRQRVLPDLEALRPNQRRSSHSAHSSPPVTAQPTDPGSRSRSRDHPCERTPNGARFHGDMAGALSPAAVATPRRLVPSVAAGRLRRAHTGTTWRPPRRRR